MPGGGRRRGSVRRCALKASAIHFWHLHPRCMLHLALSLKILALKSENRRAVRSMEAAIVVEAVVVDAAPVVEGADANGVVGGTLGWFGACGRSSLCGLHRMFIRRTGPRTRARGRCHAGSLAERLVR